ncbi:hypothetical protein EGT74_19310 [Chitinophaga lutea]|uniref:Outer membrane protein beta-barrel domain-containing protein n=1 Tax=Chitinophaga lutea TaxID=2488634 RepID=A0A3N4PZN6_9BACT|nr:hypothetical protein [Chitinophaga lutea]RPE09160.1 hypothetical protein EGT74_19310 [Chitinophaga lutea]
MKPLFISLLLLSCSFAYGQSKTFLQLEKKIKEHIAGGQWDEVLVAAPDLLIEDPAKGDGYYYTALAFLKLNQPEKATEYLAKAESLADDRLKKETAALRTEIDRHKQAHAVMENAQKEEQSGSKKAADEWQKLWEIDKTQTAYALNAVELYVEQKNYPQALEILNDPALANDEGAKTLRSRINQTPEMYKINGYNDAMALGKNNISKGNYKTAITNFDAALKFSAGDADAIQQKKTAQDELAWQAARNENTIESIEAYIKGNTIGRHKEQGKKIVKDALIRFGQQYADKNDIPQMEYFLFKYLKDYPGDADAPTVKAALCAAYLKAADIEKQKKYASSQEQALTYYNNINQYCPGTYSLNDAIRTAKRKKLRYGRPDRFFLSYVYDSLAPIGLSLGTLNNRAVGMYLTFRMSESFLTKSAYFTVNNQGELEGNVYKDIRPTGETLKGNADLMLGLTKKLTYPLWVYGGGGATLHRHWEEMSSYHDNGALYETEWVKNTDEQYIKPVVEAGLIIDLSGFNIRAGGKMIDFKDIYYSLGVGFSFKR